MKKIKTLPWIPFFFLGWSLCAAQNPGEKEGKESARKPLVIYMNYPDQPGPFRIGKKPSYSKLFLNWLLVPHPKYGKMPDQKVLAVQPLEDVLGTGGQDAFLVHPPAAHQRYIRKQLSKIGVRTEPSIITNRSEIVSTDRAHSTISYPRTGPKGETIKASLVSPLDFNSSVVRNQMEAVTRPEFLDLIARESSLETQKDYVYWHGVTGFDYTHYIDNSGYQWYGWYMGGQYFWARNYDGRWWWYDTRFNRWCFYNDNYWWWQDPYHVGDLYCYDGDGFIPVNSADDEIIVAASEMPSDMVFNSLDGKRRVKITKDNGDAFLYDLTKPPAFGPIYLASGVQNIEYSDANNGRPLEIILTLNDGSYDLFDAQGNAYNASISEGD